MFRMIQKRMEEVLHLHSNPQESVEPKIANLPFSSLSKSSLGPTSSSSGDLFHNASSHFSLPPLPPILNNRVGVLLDSPSMHPEAEEAQEDQMATYGFPSVRVEMSIEALRDFFKSRSFLFVDDNSLNLMVLTQLFKKAGITNFVKAESGPQAIELAKTHAFDVILMDYNMPEMNGDVAIKHIRVIPGREKLPIILGYSANEDVKVRNDFLAAGANDSVVKPLLEHDLLRKIYSLFVAVTAGS